MTREPLVVIGLGADGPQGLTPEGLAHLAGAQVLAGGTRHLDFFPDFRGERLVIDADLAGLTARLRDCYPHRKTVVLASGDPLYYGIGRVLLEVIPKDDLLFLPHISSVQLAFARVKETWNDARVVSLHGRPRSALLPALHAREAKIAVLTDARNDPAAVAALVCEHGLADDYVLWVCEDLGGPGERVSRWPPRGMAAATFSPLNVVILLRTEPPAGATVPLFGVPETALAHRDGMITKREIRLISLAYLELSSGDVFWDVGAGSGSVSVEAARLSSQLRVYAVEKSPDALRQIEENRRRFNLERLQVIAGEAPEALAELPSPDAVFIGGSGGRLGEILDAVAKRLNPAGRVVLNCITLETFAQGWDRLRELGFQPEATSVQLAHSRPLGSLHCLEPENPIFVLRALKP